jgi:hypothetical protein
VANVTVVVGLLLTAVGLYGRFATQTTSNTALIPAGIGAALVVLGALSYKDGLRKHAMHAAALIGLLSAVACLVMATPSWPELAREGKVIKVNRQGVERDATVAVLSQTVTGAVCAVFVGLCVHSFVQARRARRAREQAAAGQPGSSA